MQFSAELENIQMRTLKYKYLDTSSHAYLNINTILYGRTDLQMYLIS
jgi:hypothetical protein